MSFVHYAMVCEPELLAELGAAASRAIVVGDPAPVQALWRARSGRFAQFDRVDTAVDDALVERVRAFETALAGSWCADRSAIHDVLDACVRVDARVRVEGRRMVSRTAQCVLARRLDHLAAVVQYRAPDDVVDDSAARLRRALAGLHDHDYHASIVAGDGDFYDVIMACCVVELAGDLGVGEALGALQNRYDDLIPGQPLYETPYIAEGVEPAPELMMRCFDRFGHYSAAVANELLREDVERVLPGWRGSQWAAGRKLRSAIADLDAMIADPQSEPLDDDSDEEAAEELRAAVAVAVVELRRFRAVVADAAMRGHAVVEWFEKL